MTTEETQPVSWRMPKRIIAMAKEMGSHLGMKMPAFMNKLIVEEWERREKTK